MYLVKMMFAKLSRRTWRWHCLKEGVCWLASMSLYRRILNTTWHKMKWRTWLLFRGAWMGWYIPNNLFFHEQTNKKIPPHPVSLFYYLCFRLLGQLDETDTAFDDFWERHRTKLEQCLQLRHFEKHFREVSRALYQAVWSSCLNLETWTLKQSILLFPRCVPSSTWCPSVCRVSPKSA